MFETPEIISAAWEPACLWLSRTVAFPHVLVVKTMTLQQHEPAAGLCWPLVRCSASQSCQCSWHYPGEVSSAAHPVPKSRAIKRWLETGRCWHVILGAGFRGTVSVSRWDQTALSGGMLCDETDKRRSGRLISAPARSALWWPPRRHR